MRLLLLTMLSLLVCPGLAGASDPSPEDEALASQMQLSAIEAMNAGDWAMAEERARAAVGLDGGVRTSQARLVLVRALEERGEVQEALQELELLLEMELLPQHRTKVEEVEQRLRARSGRSSPAPPPGEARTPLGIALLAGAVGPTALGATFLGFDVHFATQGVESGTWAVLGTACLVAGIALAVGGGHALSGSPENAGAVARSQPMWLPTVGVRAHDEALDLQFGVVGRW